MPSGQADVMVVVACREEGDADLAKIGGQVEAAVVAVERDREVEVVDLQMHVPNANGWVDWIGRHTHSVRRAHRPSSGCSSIRKVVSEGQSPHGPLDRWSADRACA